MHALSSDQVSVREAAKRSGKSVATIKRWLRDGNIKGTPRGSGKTAPIYISLRELQAELAKRSPTISKSQVITPIQDPALIEALNRHIESLERDKGDHRQRIETLERENRDLRDRVAALEKELNGGFRGLLRGIMGR